MSRFNFQASITIVGEQYFLSEDEINFIVDEAEEWKPEDRVPPADLCLLIYDVIHHKYQDELEENSKKKLAASILKMSYFQYSDIVFTMNFGDGGSLGFFISKDDWANGDFSNVAFGYYN